ncbi:7TM GPCR, serpentine receptor class v (Srv) family-containing protein [Strongyloides ratti]|uniref:Serpentine receptor class gamma n=1 Tax=Strongyloides ratti TaxID=34506 RepID=A0A090LR39_STRRB|nr:7TM GPCR, serpentine receptor class v (Srv) family-containing protein [Strongyloides ratti]CEF70071.1 7TM GPCR, serpentine receptor class v (Srv) family-containing protein [Strongyloides ratti]
MWIFILVNLIKKNKTFLPIFYLQLLFNIFLEVLLIFFKYLVKRLPNLKFLNEYYANIKTLNGIYFGLLTILPASIGFGQFALVLNRYAAVKYPLSYKKIFSFKTLFFIYTFQILLLCPGIIMCAPYYATIRLNNQMNTVIIIFSQNKYIQILSIYNILVGLILALSSAIFGFMSWRILKKKKYSRNENSLEYKKQKKFLIFVIIQTVTDVLMYIANLFYLILILFRLKSIVLMTSFIYYFAEDICFLTTPLALCITQRRIRSLFLEFYFGFIFQRKKNKRDNKNHIINRIRFSKEKFNRIHY